MKIIHFFLVTIVLLYSCKNEPITKEIAENNNLIDSFSIDEISDKSELATIEYLNDSCLVAWGGSQKVFSFFNLDEQKFKRKYENFIEHNDRISCFFIENKKSFRIIDTKNYLYSIDTSYGVKKICKLDFSLPQLLKNFNIYSYHNNPVISQQKNLYFTIAHNDLMHYYEGLKDYSMVKLDLNEDTFSNSKYLFLKPKILEDQLQPNPMHCFNGIQIVLTYPNIDSLYIYDVVTKKYSQKYIGNNDFQLHESVDKKRLFETDYTAIYLLHNFQYKSILFNPNTKHYVLFYTLPVDSKIKTPSFEDQKIYAVILNNDFLIISYIEFQKEYMHPISFFSTPKGIAMPIINDNFKNNVQIDYNVFNF